MTATGLFPEDSAERKTFPIYSGLLMYFPSALAAVANHSFVSNEKHNPGKELCHDRAKSGDELDALCRHVMESDFVGAAWRALSNLQKHLEAQGAPVAPAARNAQIESAQINAPVEPRTYYIDTPEDLKNLPPFNLGDRYILRCGQSSYTGKGPIYDAAGRLFIGGVGSELFIPEAKNLSVADMLAAGFKVAGVDGEDIGDAMPPTFDDGVCTDD